MEIIRLEEKIAAGYRLGYDEALELMRTTSPGELYELAHRLRTRYQGKRIDTCSIMNARSGRCSEDCKWCAQSKFHKTDIDVYPLVGETEAVQEAAHNASKGVGALFAGNQRADAYRCRNRSCVRDLPPHRT